jgi:hypothetical protein
MKTIFKVLILAILSALTSTICFAAMGIAFVSKERAKELGIEVRGIANGPKEATIVLKFKPEGKLKLFRHVSLEIRDGDNFLLGWTPLKDERTSSASVVVSLMANRAFLEKVTLRIVSGEVGNYGGHDVRVADFVDLKNLTDKLPDKPQATNLTNPESRKLPASSQ